MSGSFDRPDRPTGRSQPAHGRLPEYDPYDEPAAAAAAPAPQPQAAPYAQDRTYSDVEYAEVVSARAAPGPYHPHAHAPAGGEMIAPARTSRGAAPIVPQGSVTGRSLTLVITIMCFLACLTAGAVYMIRQSAEAWLRDIASEVTVQVEPQEKVDPEKTVQEVTTFLSRQSGIAKARALSLEDSTGLLEPWLGSGDELKALPVPRLIAIELDRVITPDLDAIRGDLEKQFKGVSLDDHRHWQQQIRTITRSFSLGGMAILALVAAATMAIIVSATKSSMASNREIVEVLHFVGATDRFIAREFEKHFLRLGVRAGLVGAGLALAVFLVMPTVVELLGGGAVTLGELQRLIGTGGLDMAGYVLMGIVVVVVAALCMLTSRFGVFRILNSRH